MTFVLHFFPTLLAETVFLTATSSDDQYYEQGDSDDDIYSDTLDTAKLEAEIRSLRLALGEMEAEEERGASGPSGGVLAEASRGQELAAAAPLAARMAEQVEVRQTLVEYLNELKSASVEGAALVEFPDNYDQMVESAYTVRREQGRRGVGALLFFSQPNRQGTAKTQKRQISSNGGRPASK